MDIAAHGAISRLPVLVRKKSGDGYDKNNEQEKRMLHVAARSRYQGKGVPPRLECGIRKER
jgi:hypothetical protein